MSLFRRFDKGPIPDEACARFDKACRGNPPMMDFLEVCSENGSRGSGVGFGALILIALSFGVVLF